MWNRDSVDTIYVKIKKSIESRLTSGFTVLAGTMIDILSGVFAALIHIAYGRIENLAVQLLPSSATNYDWLKRHAKQYGVSIRTASFATGYVYFLGSNGQDILQDAIININGSEFITQTTETISNGFCKCNIEALEIGEDSNILSNVNEAILDAPTDGINEIGQIVVLGTDYTGLTGGTFAIGEEINNSTRYGAGTIVEITTGNVNILLSVGEFIYGDTITSGIVSATISNDPSNINLISGGSEEGSGEELKKRVLERIQYQPAGGSKYDYKRWSESVTGVSKAWVSDTYPAPGWVTIIIKAAGSEPEPSNTLITAVETYIDTVKVGHASVSIQKINKVTIDFDISLSTNNTFYQDLITENIEELFNNVYELPELEILLSAIRSAISSTSISDYLINGINVSSSPVAVDNITMSLLDFPVLGTITFSSL